MLKILILSASIGSGHIKAAEAIQCEMRNVGTRNEELRTSSLIPTSSQFLVPSSYVMEVHVVDFMAKDISTLNWLTKKFCPDVVICTHPFPEAAASLWKFLHAKSEKNFLLATVLTDYSLHEIWIYGEVDFYFVATEEMKTKLAAHCRAGQKIFATGIPIDERFSVAEKISDNSRTTILIMGGGLGLGSIEETLSELNKIKFPLKILVVAGQNENLLSRLRKEKFSHPTEIFGYVSEIDKLMAQADLLITKPGALTMTEAFAAGVPLILHAPIPGPEALNAEYAISHGAAIAVGDKKISAVVEELLIDPARLAEMKRSAKKISRPFAAKEIVNKLINPL